MHIVMRSIDSLRPAACHRRYSTRTIAKVAASIQARGFMPPLVIEEDHTIIVGHTRWRAAQRLGLKEVPVVMAEHRMQHTLSAERGE